MATGSALADQYIDWLTQVLTTWVGNHGSETIAGINSATNDSPNSTSNSCTVRTTTGSSETLTRDQVHGVLTLTPPAATAPAAGGTGTYTVGTSPGATWTATPDQPWLTASVNGTTVTWTAAASTETVPRTGMIVNGGTAGQVSSFAVTQDGAPAVMRH